MRQYKLRDQKGSRKSEDFRQKELKAKENPKKGCPGGWRERYLLLKKKDCTAGFVTRRSNTLAPALKGTCTQRKLD